MIIKGCNNVFIESKYLSTTYIDKKQKKACTYLHHIRYINTYEVSCQTTYLGISQMLQSTIGNNLRLESRAKIKKNTSSRLK